MATQIAPTPVVKGTEAVKIYKEAMTSINNDIGLSEVNIRGIDNIQL